MGRTFGQLIINVFVLFWGFTESDFLTFVVPDTLFGTFGAFAATSLSSGIPPSTMEIVRRLPLVVLYNWTNLLSFDLANQRSPESLAEDRINKPWRPLPTGKITGEQTRRAMIGLIPVILCLNRWLGVWEQTVVIHIITWLYNDLRGMDEPFVREILISAGYAMFNQGSLQIALGDQAIPNQRGTIWTGIISAVILTTMQVQDLKDQGGDRLRGRKTIVLFLGNAVSRCSIAFFVGLWTWVCIWFWSLSWWPTLVPGLPAAWIICRVVAKTSRSEDRRTWYLWCVWLVALYSVPLFASRTAALTT